MSIHPWQSNGLRTTRHPAGTNAANNPEVETAASRPTLVSMTARKSSTEKKASSKKASSKKAPAKRQSPEKDVAQKEASESRSGFSSVQATMGHVFQLRPKVSKGFRPDDFRRARQLLAEESYESIAEAARAVAERALELTRENSGKAVKPKRM